MGGEFTVVLKVVEGDRGALWDVNESMLAIG
jgi:hypothetical protein